jgi:hypothetical protein
MQTWKKAVKTLLATGLLALCLAGGVRGSDFPHSRELLLLPTGWMSNSLIAELAWGLGDHWALALRGTSTNHWRWEGGKNGANDDYDWIYDLNGLGLGLSARFYPGGNSPQGYFVGPRIDYLAYQGTYEDRAQGRAPVDVKLQVTTVHVETGYQFIFKERFVFAPFIDAGWPRVRSSDSGAALAGIVTFIIGGGFYLGWAF